MSLIKTKVITVIKNPKSILIKALHLTSPIFTDSLYLKLLFPISTGYRLNLKNPKTYNEKLQWLKINYRKPIMTQMVDKYAAKDFARDIIGNEYIIDSYGVWDSFEEIDFDVLPEQFVLKTTHDQGGVVIITDKDSFDREAAKENLTKHLKFKHYYLTREWPYKDVKPRILAEKLLSNNSVEDLYDYKFLCFNGKTEVMYVKHGSDDKGVFFDFFDMNFDRIDINTSSYPQSSISFPKPKNWELMKSLAEKLSKGWPHIRIDFYNINGNVYLGELTFYLHGGLSPFKPKEWNNKFGDLIDIEEIKKEINLVEKNEDC